MGVNGVEVIPSAQRLVKSLRDVGYEFATAVADLIDNSVEAKANTVWIDVVWDGESSYVTIADNGEGMSQNTLARLFEPFHSTKGLRGTGLGLVVTKKIVEEHGGLVKVESTRKQGTTFTIRLPVRFDQVPMSADTIGPG